MLAVTEEVCPDIRKDHEDISLSSWTFARCAKELGTNLFERFHIRVK
jgi:hypothetical protein